jgi:hypothetical protein
MILILSNPYIQVSMDEVLSLVLLKEKVSQPKTIA